MGEKVEETNDQIGMMPMSPEMLMGIHRVFAEKISFEVRGDATTLTFGSIANIKASDKDVTEEIMIPQVICFLTIPHMFRLRDLLVRQCGLLEKMMEEQKEGEVAKKDVQTD